ncbi:uncharacterized protein EAF02_001473 [Botrytis sinoallii]|uniref:uncharacterized protein n=1 Tax=Botrytis sinoallii TaxID=1463999 RepID=UPI0019012BB4|nr:uncharacterized protein EAF02_001473 [Botrytis sinoallii]KAF7891148.1 hypothetical protein EAF02_001473 [Botrytis sinoallii]
MDRRLIRAPKGTFMRAANISQYTEEIEKIYKNADVLSINNDDLTGDTRQHVAPTGLDGTTRLVRQQILAATGWPSLDNDVNLFDRGIDSLQGLQLTRTLRRIFHHPGFAPSTVYQNPTVSHWHRRYHLLQALLSRDRNAHVFCLDRGKDGGRDTQCKNFVAAGIPTSQLDKRVTFIKVNVESQFLGLDSTLYDSLRSEVNLIFHTAWPVNFNLPLSAFRPQLAALVNLFTLAASAASNTVRFIFISSIAAVEGHRHGPAPEKILESLEAPAPFGYGRAKFPAELLVDAGGRHPGNKVPTTVIRVGQVAVLSSLHFEHISDSLGPGFDNVDFVPVDLLSHILVVLATAATAEQPITLRREADYEDMAANPAVKLLYFFEGLWAIHANTEKVPMQPMVVEKALEASPTMRKLDAVKVERMHKWVEEWVAARK